MDPYQKKKYRKEIHAFKQTEWERSHLHKLSSGVKRVSIVVMLDQRCNEHRVLESHNQSLNQAYISHLKPGERI